MARSGVLFSHIAIAAEKLVAEGRNPTVDAVREALGGTGSKSTIGPLLKRWKEENEAALTPVELGVPAALLQAVKMLHDGMQGEFHLKLEQARQVHEATELRSAEEVQQWRAQHTADTDLVATLRATIAAANLSVTQLQEANQLLTAALTTANSEGVGLQQRLTDRAAEVAALNGQLTQSRAQFDHYQESIAAQRSEERQAFEQRAARMDLELGTLRQQSMYHQANAAQLAGQFSQATAESTRLQGALQAAQDEAAHARFTAERSAFDAAALGADLDHVKAKHDHMAAELTATQIALAVQRREAELGAGRLVAADSQAHAQAQEMHGLLRQLAVLDTELRQARDIANELSLAAGKPA